mgnify:CR=1 FL=1
MINNDKEYLQSLYKSGNKEAIEYFIRCELSGIGALLFDEDDMRMGGRFCFGGNSIMENQSILNIFEKLGIYGNDIAFLSIGFYKGLGVIYMGDSDIPCNITNHCIGGLSTTQIIYKVFELTIFAGIK